MCLSPVKTIQLKTAERPEVQRISITDYQCGKKMNMHKVHAIKSNGL